MYQETSRLAYAEALKDLNTKQKVVFYTIQQLGTPNDREIAAALGWPINRITPRRGELVELGLIKKDRCERDPFTERKVNYWKATPTENESR